MNPDHLVQVFAHAAGGGGRIGTAYPVAADRLLTAKHVLAFEGATGQIEVRWYNLAGRDQEWRPAQIEWEGGEGVDAAVLRCEFPLGFVAAPYLISCAEPWPEYKWRSAGFVRPGASKERPRQPTPLTGEILPLAANPSRSGTFELGVDYEAASAEDWQGASGCPVFVGQRILGLVASTQRSFQARRLTATATCQLLEDPKFCAAIGYTEKWKGLQDYKRKLIAVLSGSKKAAERLASEMKLDLREAWRGDDVFTRVVVDGLLLEQLDVLLPRLSAAHRDLFRDGVATHAEAIWRTACLVMPAVCDAGDVDVSAWLGSGHGLLRLPAATETLAEIILAAADRRDARFGPGAGRPEPLLRIPAPPAGGETAGLSQFEREWHEYAIKRFVDPQEKTKARQHETLVKLASDELTDLATYRNERYYYVVEVSDPASAAEWTDVVMRLQRAYPAVAFVTLVGTDPELLRERKLRFHITDMLAQGKYGAKS